MLHSAMCSAFVPHRRTRAFFLLRTAQHVRSGEVAREIVRALLALAAAVGWGSVAILLASA
jgi:hypothetical protein